MTLMFHVKHTAPTPDFILASQRLLKSEHSKEGERTRVTLRRSSLNCPWSLRSRLGQSPKQSNRLRLILAFAIKYCGHCLRGSSGHRCHNGYFT